jgi:CDP-ribitol ribitolphosphotransferase
LSSLKGYSVSTELYDPSNKTQHEKIIREIATAKFVVIDEPLPILAGLRLRSETAIMLLPMDPFSIKGKAKERAYSLSWQKKYSDYINNNHVSILQVPSEYQEDAFTRSYCNSDSSTRIIPGNCATDVYFNKQYCDAARKKLKKMFPEAGDRKIILYMPTLRTVKDCDKLARLLDLETLKDLVGNEYAVVVDFNKLQAKEFEFFNTVDIPGFSREISRGIDIRELIAAAYIIVGDYRNSFYEASMLKKPMFSTIYDGEAFLNAQDAAKQYMIDDSFCPVVRDAIDLAKELKNISEYDFEKIKHFRERFFGGCDGRSVDRVVDYIRNYQEETVERKLKDLLQEETN